MAEKKAKTNKQYKDRMFIDLFSDKKNLLQLYSAVRGTADVTEEEIEVNTLEGILFLNMRNDISMIIQEELSLYEHQSTDCPNMPLRSFMYSGRLYEGMTMGRAVYSKKLIPIPAPEFIVFYNGPGNKPPEWEMKLSDAYITAPSEPNLELKVRVININYLENPEFLSKCQPLKEYSAFVEMVRDKRKKYSLQEAIRLAIIESKEKGILKDYLQRNGAEVENMLMTEYDREMDIEVNREEAREEGILQAKIETILDFLSDLGTVPESLRAGIQRQADVEILKRWVKIAAKASSIEDFLEKIQIDAKST